jgi:EF hand
MFAKFSLCIVVSLIVSSAGCGGPKTMSKNEPATAAVKAVEAYDKNGDGKLSGDEVKKAPALAASGKRVDRNRDGTITKDEIETRMKELDNFADFVALEATVLSKGKPLTGAEVTLTPEAFMGDSFPTYRGTVQNEGRLPLVNDGKTLPGIPTGFYTAHIMSAGKEIVVGVEIADDTTGSRLEIAL